MDPPLAVAAEMTWPVTPTVHQAGPLRVAGRRGAHRQDSRDSTSGPVPAAMRRGCARALRAAPGGLNGGETCPLMLIQQPAKLGVLRPQERLRVAHTAMIVDRGAARQDGPARAAPPGPPDPRGWARRPGLPGGRSSPGPIFQARRRVAVVVYPLGGRSAPPGAARPAVDPLLGRPACAAGQPAFTHVSRQTGLPGSDREFPPLTGRSGTHRARLD